MMQRRRFLGAGVPLVWAALPAARAQAQLQAELQDYREPRAVYAAIAALQGTAVRMGAAEINVVFAPEVPAVQQAPMLVWVGQKAAALAHYYDGFPLARCAILITSTQGARVAHGTAWGHGGPVVRVEVGRDAGTRAFDADWILAHEMVHLAFPSMWRRHLWLQEGSASYVEPIARAQAGQITALAVWREFVNGMPKGLPQAGDLGLDRTPTWGRTYWGGALFCLQADVQMRQQTGNRLGLQHALRAIARESGGNGTSWGMGQVLAAADRAVGVPVLSDLYAAQAQASGRVDLDALLAALGVVGAGPTVRLDDGAPLAAVRRAITAA